jgi:hypothetical protein
LLAIIFGFCIRAFIVRIINHDDFSQHFIKLVTTGLFVPSPFDENIKTYRLHDPASVLPTSFPEKKIVPGMRMTNMRQNRKLDPTRQCQILL